MTQKHNQIPVLRKWPAPKQQPKRSLHRPPMRRHHSRVPPAGPEQQARPEPEAHVPADAQSTVELPSTKESSDSEPIETAQEQDASSSMAPSQNPKPPEPSVQPTPPEVDQPEVVTAHIDGTRKDGAASIPETAIVKADELSPAQASLWRAVGNGRIGLAYHIARLDNSNADRETRGQPSPRIAKRRSHWGVRSAAPTTIWPAPSAASSVHSVVLTSTVSEAPTRDALNLLLFSATLRPALLSAQRGASVPLLRRVELSGDLSAVRGLATTVADYAGTAADRSPRRLDTRYDARRGGVERPHSGYCRRGPPPGETERRRRPSFFAPASYVWQRLMGRSGVLGELARMLKSDRHRDVPRVREIVSLLG